MISYFRPFMGSGANHTKDVAYEIEKQFKESGRDIEIVLCPIKPGEGINVSFYSDRRDLKDIRPLGKRLQGGNTAFEQVQECLKQNPDIKNVVSLGQGQCEINYENYAYNVMETGDYEIARDHNDNLIPYQQKISSTAPDSVNLDGINNLKAYCIASAMDSNFTEYGIPGTDPGNYVCNNLSFNMQYYIQKTSPDIHFEFVHVPPYYDELEDYVCSLPSSVSDKLGEDKRKNFTNYIATKVSTFIQAKQITLNLGKQKNIENIISCSKNKETGIEDFRNNIADILNGTNYIKKCTEEYEKEMLKERAKNIIEKQDVYERSR